MIAMSLHDLPSESALKRLSRYLGCRHVLCLVDSTSEPEPAVGAAKALATWSNGVCRVLMCLDVSHRKNSDGSSSIDRHAPLTPEVISRTESKLSGLYGKGIMSMVLPGHPVTELRRYARNNDVDLIVIGEQGLALEQEYQERICDNAPCPVMTLVFPRIKEVSFDPDSNNNRQRTKHER